MLVKRLCKQTRSSTCSVYSNFSQTNKLKLDLNNGGFGGLFSIRFFFYYICLKYKRFVWGIYGKLAYRK